MPDRGWVDLILSRSALGENTRRLLGTALLIPFLLGWLISFGESQGWFDSGLGRSTYAVAVMLLMGLVVIYNAHRLQQAEAAHRTLEANLSVVSRQLNSLVENSPSAIFIKDIDGRYQLVNSHFERLVQKTRAAIIGRKAEAIFSKSLLPAVLETDRRVIETRGVANVEIATELEGAQRVYLNTKFPLFSESGEILGLGGIWTDITEQKQLSETLQIKNVDLERSNKELEQFAYVASHDLQEPLRMVSSYMQLLESRYKDKLDDDAKEFIDFAVDGAARMQRLIQDLLAFSRVGTRGKEPEIVDSSQSVAEALRNLKVRIEENGATVNAAGLPVVFVDRNQLTQVFQNLIGNAVKFKGEKPPVVDITARDQGELFEFTVSDNGIGFDQKHADRIFTIFQRLNSREQYEGTGIGLSICKKIVERHGGKIWAESSVGQGATFRFTLPKPPEEDAITGAPAAEAAAIEVPGADAIGERAGRMI
jgi:PAS domain S-box-containing protein